MQWTPGLKVAPRDGTGTSRAESKYACQPTGDTASVCRASPGPPASKLAGLPAGIVPASTSVHRLHSQAVFRACHPGCTGHPCHWCLTQWPAQVGRLVDQARHALIERCLRTGRPEARGPRGRRRHARHICTSWIAVCCYRCWPPLACSDRLQDPVQTVEAGLVHHVRALLLHLWHQRKITRLGCRTQGTFWLRPCRGGSGQRASPKVS